jgi:hypothetical protein
MFGRHCFMITTGVNLDPWLGRDTNF